MNKHTKLVTVITLMSGVALLSVGCSQDTPETVAVSPVSSAELFTSAGITSADADEAGSRLLRFADELGLTEEQISQITEIIESYRGQLEELRASISDAIPTEEQRETYLALRVELHEAIFAVLTEEQQAKLTELRAQHMGEGRRSRRGSHHH